MAKRLLCGFPALRHHRALPLLVLSATLLASSASAQEKVYFTAVEKDPNSAQDAIKARILAETVRIDVGVWMLVDGEIVGNLIKKFKDGVQVRVLGDRITIFEQTDKNTYDHFMMLANAGVPIRVRRHPTWFPEIMHWKAGLFVGQGIVEFGSANWTTFELEPTPNPWDFKDETAFFTNDPAVFNAMLTKFDEYWADTTYFEDWPAAYKAETGQNWTLPMTINRSRLVSPGFPTDIPGMIWSQGSELTNAMLAEINAEPNTGAIDMVSYRLTVPAIADALIAKKKAGVNVRVFIEPSQYRNAGYPEFWMVGAMTDKMWAAGIPIKQRLHQGLTHMKTLTTGRSVLIASSNFTANWQRDHNYFVSATQKPLIHQAHKDRFNAMWNDTVNYTAFKPTRPMEARIPNPANRAINVATTTRLEWDRAAFATSFDVYLAPAGTPLGPSAYIGRVDAVVTDNPPETYSIALPPLQPNTTYDWKVVSRTYASDLDPTTLWSSDVWSFTTASSGGGGTTSGPFGGTPIALPGTIEAENFDNGGMNIAYYDQTTGNAGGAYRLNDHVDIEATTDTTGGVNNIGWVAAGEWLQYTVNVGTAGTYNLEFRIAAPNAGGTFHVEVNGQNKTGAITVPSTGGWQNWTTVVKTGVSLAAGQQVWRLVFDTAGYNVNYIRVVSGGGTTPPAGPTPFGGTRTALPGTLQAENFDLGGSGIGYLDSSAGNAGGATRTFEDVDIEATTDGGPGYNIGWMAAGEWLNYSVNVTTAGTYTVEFRVAAAGSGGSFRLLVDGVDKTGPMTIPNTGGWQTWTTVSKTGVTLAAGNQNWRLVVDNAGSFVGNLNFIRVVAAAGGTPTASPFGGTAPPLPGTIEVEKFDDGGANLGYVDNSLGNSGGEFRATDVDIERVEGTTDQYNIGWVGAGEWLRYTVNVTTAGTYTLQFRVASPATGGTFRLEINGFDVTGTLAVPNTGGWQTWLTIQKAGVTLAAGPQVWRLVMLSNGPAIGGVGNFDWIRVVSGTASLLQPVSVHADAGQVSPLPSLSMVMPAGTASLEAMPAEAWAPGQLGVERRRDLIARRRRS